MVGLIQSVKVMGLSVWIISSVGPLWALPQNRSESALVASEQALIDAQVTQSMDAIGATAAALAISYNGRVVYSKGYGHSDRRGRKPTSERIAMRLASCTKPFTAAAIRELIRQGKIDIDTRVFDYLDIPPWAALADRRIREITISDLLTHRGGWDRDQTFDPMYEIDRLKSELGVSKVTKKHIVRYMWDQPLQNSPGTVRSYSNFGFLLLGLVIEKATDQSYVVAIRDLVTAPIDAGEVFLSSSVRRNRKSREVFYPKENKLNLHLRDSASGLATDAVTLCNFMEHYWLDGRKRKSRDGWFFFQIGTHPFCTSAFMEQREDGISFSALFNRRREDHYLEDNAQVRARLNQAIDRIAETLRADEG